MNKELYVNIKISMPNGSDMSFSDEEIKEIQDYYEKEFSNFDYLVGEINVSFVDEKTKQITQLKQQLAEKDCRIEELEGQFAYECECNKQLVDLQKQLAEKDKEKTQLAIQELEKVRDNLRYKTYNVNDKMFDYIRTMVLWTDLNDIIDHQIKELKGE